MHKINIELGYASWAKQIDSLERKTKSILKSCIETQKFFLRKNVEMTVLLTNSARMKKLNYTFRKKNKDTDVLSFPSHEALFFKKGIKPRKIYIGDIALSYNYIKKQKLNFEDYYKKILIHGFLHLVGYDHILNKDFYRMQKEEIRILKLV
jgi:probable rRNA maturation factor